MADPPLALLDTNVLVYAASRLPTDAKKRARAVALISSAGVAVCAQVLHEFYNVSTRKGPSPLRPSEALIWLDQFDAFPSVDLDRAMVKRGAALSIEHGLSYWDGAILAAAERLGAGTLYTEDLTHGRAYGRVRVDNPFLAL